MLRIMRKQIVAMYSPIHFLIDEIDDLKLLKKIVNINFLSLILNFFNQIFECFVMTFNMFSFTSNIVIGGILSFLDFSVVIIISVKNYINLNIKQSNKIVYNANASIKKEFLKEIS
jgi:hypothetical protein